MEKIRRNYKKTEVGIIPEEWQTPQISELSKITTGNSDTQDKVDSGLFQFFVRSQKVERINKYKFDCEAILTSGDGVGVGKIFHYVNGKFDFHQRVYCLYDFHINTYGKYLFYQFSANFFNRVMAMTAKSSVDSVRRDMISKMRIPLPPTISEQKAIADALSEIDELISNLEKLISKKKAIKYGTMQQLLKPPQNGGKRLTGYTKQWKEIKLGDYADFFKGKELSKSDIVEEGKFKCIHYGELFTKYNEIIDSVKSRTNKNNNAIYSKINDVLMPTSDVTPNGLARASTINEDGVILGGDILVIRPKINLLGSFISYQISNNKQNIMAKVSGTTVYHLLGSDMAKFKLFAPDIVEQKEITDVFKDLENEIIKHQIKLDKYKIIKIGMMQELLTGKTRLI